MSKVGWVRAKLIEVYEKVNPSAKHLKDKIYLNGEDNLYPNTIVNLINESPTAKRCSNLMAKFIVGNGVVEDIDIDKRFTLNDLSNQISRGISQCYESYIWVGYGIGKDGTLIKKSYKVFSGISFRKQVNDSDGKFGKLILKDWNEKKQFFGQDKDKSEKWYYPFNDNLEVVRAQIEKDFGGKVESPEDLVLALKKYRGQVYYLNLTPEYHYALPLWDSVFNDMNSEAHISRYTNSQTRNGFLGKTICISKGLDEPMQNELNETLKGFLGSESSSDFASFSFDANANIEDLKFIQLKPQFDDKLFESTKKDLRKNISGAFNNIPEELIYSTGGLFGQSSDKYNEMKRFYWEQNEYERKSIINCLWDLGFTNVTFRPLYTIDNIDNSNEIRLKSQAELKGSVGGITALITLQQSVATGTTELQSAVEIIKEIYGITEDVARRMLGEIEVVQETPSTAL